MSCLLWGDYLDQLYILSLCLKIPFLLYHKVSSQIRMRNKGSENKETWAKFWRGHWEGKWILSGSTVTTVTTNSAHSFTMSGIGGCPRLDHEGNPEGYFTGFPGFDENPMGTKNHRDYREPRTMQTGVIQSGEEHYGKRHLHGEQQFPEVGIGSWLA